MYSSKHNQAQKNGWLHKRGGRIQTWHKRWFVLTGDLLFYYKSPQDSRPTGTIPLAGNNVIRHQDDFRQLHACKFEIIAGSGRDSITSTHDSYMISAESTEDADEWVAAIKRVLYEPYGGGMFGRKLEETMTVEARLGGEYVPILVHRCAKFILEHGINETGIFRLPGQSSRVQALKDTYDCGSQLDISTTEDVHTVASLFKLYLRELPEPVIPFSLFNDAIRASKEIDANPQDGIPKMIELLKRLPKCNYNLLKYICRFLYSISQNSDQNRMTNVNLATVFGPNILRPEAISPHNIIESSNASANFCCALISHQREIFPLTSDEKPPKRLSIVNSAEIAEMCASSKSISKTGGSLFIKSTSPKFEPRGRLGSVPSRLNSGSPLPPDNKLSKKRFNMGLESPRQARKFNAFSAFGDTLEVKKEADMRSGRVSPLIFSTLNDDESTLPAHVRHIRSNSTHFDL
ncbi:PREDICTED: rho GTPase-activating protein 24-like [Amphimedon queenslandica]|uniref:Rho GTPase-activating protein n=1 Tax=Amphimedon queenslandica TaxID=400682 RepID=A0AAN0IYN2_AMPQE|nr:PREDICTED: rho GTPase-activating protein 24-like [Amphimedon queenslandica]|eukprot:XP_019849875.1 PREDICTED: rho GTPase-activating protein 24-like [Amphimedon queenslandica]